MRAIKFINYRHQIILPGSKVVYRSLIALKDVFGLLHFTDWHRFCFNPRQRVKDISSDNTTRVDYIVKMLNYVFRFEGITKLNDLSPDIVERFLVQYAACELPDDDDNTMRKSSTVNICVSSIMDFITNLYEDQGEKCSIKPDDMYRVIKKQDKHGKLVKVKVPKFDLHVKDYYKAIFRDIPTRAFDIIFYYVADNYPHLLGLIILCAFAGLRPSEACNVRREDSPLGPGILFLKEDGVVTDVMIDLRREIKLRSDNVYIGKIKKHRMQRVPPLFRESFIECYNSYIAWLDETDRKFEKEYGALSVNKQGKAVTYASFYTDFKTIIAELIPTFLSDSDPGVVTFGRALLETNIGPHILRHWYTVQLVLNGVNDVNILMDFRGDTSPESALTYLSNKGEIVKQYEQIANESFNYLSWAAKTKKENKK